MNDSLRELLTREQCVFEVMTHPAVYTAQERAAACHITGGRLAKVVIVRDGDWFAMAVVPATSYLDIDQLRAVTGRPGLRLAREAEFARVFPDCDPGAMPAFGHLYGLSVFLDTSLADGPELAFEAGTHREEIRMPMGEYLRLAKPAMASLAAGPPRAA